MRIKHQLTNKIPIIAIALWVIVSLSFDIVGESIVGLSGLSKVMPKDAANIASIIGAVLFLVVMRLWYMPEYKGVMESGLSKKMTFGIMSVFLVKCIVVLIVQLIQYNGWFNPSIHNIIQAITAGVSEETLFRVTCIPIAMGFLKSRKRVWYVPLISAIIFGALHLGNIASGATMTNSIVQTITSALDGFYYAVLFVCTGSALPGIILHALFDFICFAGDASLTDGVLTTPLQTWEIIYNIALAGVMAIFGAVALKKVGSTRIINVWKEKWSLDEKRLIESKLSRR